MTTIIHDARYQAAMACVQRLKALGLPPETVTELLGVMLAHMAHGAPSRTLAALFWDRLKHVRPGYPRPATLRHIVWSLAMVDLGRGKHKDRAETDQFMLEALRLGRELHGLDGAPDVVLHEWLEAKWRAAAHTEPFPQTLLPRLKRAARQTLFAAGVHLAEQLHGLRSGTLRVRIRETLGWVSISKDSGTVSYTPHRSRTAPRRPRKALPSGA